MTLRRLGWPAAMLVALAVAIPAAAQNTPSRTHGEDRREQWQKVDHIFKEMGVRPGAVVADIGAGDGFFTVRLSRAVGPDGRVHAVDVASDALRRLRTRIGDEQLSNVEVVEGAFDDPKLAPGSIDAALIVNAYHEMNQHQAMLTKIRAALKPGGRLVIVEPIASSRRDSRREDQTRNHEIGVDFVREDARAAGLSQVLVQDPFTSRPQGNDEEWLLVLTPAPARSEASQQAAADAGQVFSAKNEDWKAPELRISVEEFKRRASADGALVLDVRDPESYRQGHLPGALLMTPEELSTPAGVARLKGEKRLIVAYCS
jgi:FkbM family methyltransferase